MVFSLHSIVSRCFQLYIYNYIYIDIKYSLPKTQKLWVHRSISVVWVESQIYLICLLMQSIGAPGFTYFKHTASSTNCAAFVQHSCRKSLRGLTTPQVLALAPKCNIPEVDDLNLKIHIIQYPCVYIIYMYALLEII